MDSKLFAVIDTNVLVSALISTNLATPPLVVIAHVYSGDITPVFNDEIIREYCDVLSREKFHLDPTDIDHALSTPFHSGEVSGKRWPISPRARAPRRASQRAWMATSPS